MDETEGIRRVMVATQQLSSSTREQLEDTYAEVMDTKEAIERYQFLSFLAPFVSVRRRSDGMRGSLEFQHTPRYYYNFKAS